MFMFRSSVSQFFCNFVIPLSAVASTTCVYIRQLRSQEHAVAVCSGCSGSESQHIWFYIIHVATLPGNLWTQWPRRYSALESAPFCKRPQPTVASGCPPCGRLCGEFPSQRPVARSFDVFFDLRLNKWLSEQSKRRWFETPLCSLCRHCNGKLISWIYYDIRNNLESFDICVFFSSTETMVYKRPSFPWLV